MKCRRTTSVGPFITAVLLAWSLSDMAPRAYGETPAYELCIEESPSAAGTVTPNSGTHRFSANSVVTLSADPEPGYQFAYWLGDVADPASQRTTVQVNAPKVVVAVFRPADKNRFEELHIGGAGGGGGALLPTTIDLSAPGWSPGGGGGKSETRTIIIPVIQTPEPTAIVLLAFGALALRGRTRQRA